MDYLSSKELSEKWGIGRRRIIRLAHEGRIPGAKLFGKTWVFPADAVKPIDGRTCAAKAEARFSEKEQSEYERSNPGQGGIDEAETVTPADDFRFPGFEYRTLSSFCPPLNEEELVIKAATEAVYACRFKDAKTLLGNLADTTNDRYVRINALYTGCMIDIFLGRASHFLDYYSRLSAEFTDDFAHKAEMMEYIYSIDATLGNDTYYGRDFRLLPGYEYHESFLSRLANLSAVSLTIAGAKPTAAELRTHELNCILLRNSEARADLVSLHLYLGIAYSESKDAKGQDYHLKTAFNLAEKYEIYYPVAYHYYYMEKLLEPVISEFPNDFIKRIKKLSRSMYRTLTRFINERSLNNIYGLLQHGDYIFLYYAVHGLTNKETAGRLHLSLGAVSKRYGEIYALLGVKNKAQLIELYKQSQIGA